MAEYQIELYSIDVANNQFVLIDELGAFSDLTFFSRLNNVGGASFKLSNFDPKANTTNLCRWRVNVAIKRNGTIIWLGPIANIRSNAEDVSGSVEIECISYFGHLQTRLTPSDYIARATDAGEIAWELIDLSQQQSNGELMFRQGSLEPIADIDDTQENNTVANAIIDSTNNINGYDFDLRFVQDADGRLTEVLFDVSLGLGSIRTDLPPLQIGVNASNPTYYTTGELINYVRSYSSGFTNTIEVESENAPSQVGYTRREAVSREYSISLESTLQRKADLFINDSAGERYAVNLTLMPNTVPGLSDFIIGDILELDLRTDPAGFLEFQGTARVVALEISVDENGAEYITPQFEIYA